MNARTLAEPGRIPYLEAMSEPSLDLLGDLVAAAKRAGADAADALLVDGVGLAVARRLGKLEGIERSEGSDLGLRVFVGKRQATVSANDFGKEALAEVVERAVAMARAAPEDPFCGLADADQLARSFPDLELEDAEEPAPERLGAMAAAAEDAALAVAGVSNSEGADAGWGRGRTYLVASNGFAGGYGATTSSLGASVVAGAGDRMERDYDGATTRFFADLPDPATIGRSAGERAVRRLGARKVKTAKVPVVYDPRISRGLLGHLAGAISGPAIARGTSFLKDRLGQAVFAPGIRITDDPHRRRGLRSRPFDGEGIATRAFDLVDDGRLTTWLLDCRSARQLGLRSTGHAARGTSGVPAPSTTNLYLHAGRQSPAALMADIDQGFYVTELIGMGVNLVTGDYSRGAAGFWIERGVLTYPVSEVTIAGKLPDMFRAMTPADDLVFRYGTDAPTVRVDGMTVAGL